MDTRNYHPASDLLQNRVVLVTGAGDGIGRAAATTFAAHGATVILFGRTRQKLEAAYDDIVGAGYPQPAIFPLDLAQAKEQDYAGVAITLDREFGRLDGLLHNAAILPFLSRIDDYDMALWNQVIQVNLTAPFMLTQVCLPLLRRADDASLLFTSDRVGRRGRAYWGAYGVSKFGIEGLMQILAEETEKHSHIRVNSIAPVPTRTNMRIRNYPGENPRRLPTAESIMGTYLYLMGPDSTGITGEAFVAEPTANA